MRSDIEARRSAGTSIVPACGVEPGLYPGTVQAITAQLFVAGHEYRHMDAIVRAQCLVAVDVNDFDAHVFADRDSPELVEEDVAQMTALPAVDGEGDTHR
jgi:hypothetical protein